MIVRRILAVFALCSACATTDVPDTCTTDADCFQNSGYLCDEAVTQTCLQGCAQDTDCLDSEHCDTGYGVCRFGET